MTNPVNAFKQGLRDRRKQVGFWLSTGSATNAEIAATSGFDWVLIDMEHAPNDPVHVLEQVRAIGGRTEVLVRLAWNDPVLAKRVLDIGVRSLMFPYVQSVEEAQKAVAATRFPPDGVRGVAGSRANDYARVPGYHRTAHEQIAVIVQLESRLGLENAAAIAAVPGIDCVFVGPNDLSASLGHLGDTMHPEVRAAIAEARGRIVAGGAAPGILEFNIEAAQGLFAAGYCAVAVGGDAAVLGRGALELRAKFSP